MTVNSIEFREVEIELVLQTWDDIFPGGCPRLDKNYFIEDQRGNGRGLVISEDMPPSGNLDEVIFSFLSPISRNAEALRSFSPVLRIAVYNRAFSCSLYIKSLPLILQFGADLEINVYPTSDEVKTQKLID